MKSIILKLTGLKLIASITGLFYYILQVRIFGATAEVDAFFVAISAVYMISSLVQSGQLSEVLLPEYLKQKRKFGDRGAHDLLSVILNRMVVFITPILVILYFFSPLIISIIGPGLDPDIQALSADILSLSLIIVILTVISAFINTTLNAEQIFGRAETTGIINGVISISILLFFHEQFQIFTLVYALIAGKFMEFVIGLVFLKRIGYSYRFIWNLPDFNLLKFFRLMITTSGYVGATQLYSVVLTAMATFLPAGTFSIYNYVMQLSGKASGIIMGPVSTVFFSKFSKLASEGKKNLVNYLEKPLIGLLLFTFVIFCFILLSGHEILHILWSKRSLTDNEFLIAYLMLCLNFFGFIFNANGSIFRKTAVAMGYAKPLYKMWIGVQIFSAFYAFVSIYFLGTVGLASIIVVNMVLMASASFIMSQRSGINAIPIYRKLAESKNFGTFLISVLISTLVMMYFFTYMDISMIPSLVIKIATLGIVVIGLGYALFPMLIKRVIPKLIPALQK